MLEVKASSWVDRIYNRWYHDKYDSLPPEHVNLCPYLRAIMFWSWLRLIFLNDSPWVSIPVYGILIGLLEGVGWSVFLYGMAIEQFLPASGLWFSILLLVICWIILHIVMIVFAIIIVIDNFDEWFPKTDAAIGHTIDKTVDRIEKKFSAVTSAFDFVGDILRLFAAKAHAAHENICPVIRRGVD